MKDGEKADGWGKDPQKTGGGTRDTAYIQYNGSDICQFVPLTDVQYHLSVITTNGWTQPVEIWSHDVYVNGRYVMNVYCRNTKFGMDQCPMCKANNLEQSRRGVQKLKNAERPFPVKKKYVFPIVVDEIPEKPFLLYKVSEKFMENLANQFVLAGGPDMKLVLLRTGKGKTDTQYSVSNSGKPVNKTGLKNAKVPKITVDTYKDFLVSLEDIDKFGLNFENAGSTGAAVDNNYSDQQADDNSGQPDTSGDNGSSGADADLNFEMTFGPYAGKKLKDLEDQVLVTIAKNMTGEVQAHAQAVLKSKGK